MHVVLTLLLYFIFINVFSFNFRLSLAALLVLVLSSLFPDLDHPKSKIRGLVTAVFFFLSFILLFSYLNYDVLEKSVFSLFGSTLVYLSIKHFPISHRGRKSLHQWHLAFFVPFCFAVVFYILGINYFLSFFIFFGYVSHLLLDRIGIK